MSVIAYLSAMNTAKTKAAIITFDAVNDGSRQLTAPSLLATMPGCEL